MRVRNRDPLKHGMTMPYQLFTVGHALVAVAPGIVFSGFAGIVQQSCRQTDAQIGLWILTRQQPNHLSHPRRYAADFRCGLNGDRASRRAGHRTCESARHPRRWHEPVAEGCPAKYQEGVWPVSLSIPQIG